MWVDDIIIHVMPRNTTTQTRTKAMSLPAVAGFLKEFPGLAKAGGTYICNKIFGYLVTPAKPAKKPEDSLSVDHGIIVQERTFGNISSSVYKSPGGISAATATGDTKQSGWTWIRSGKQ